MVFSQNENCHNDGFACLLICDNDLKKLMKICRKKKLKFPRIAEERDEKTQMINHIESQKADLQFFLM